MTLSSAARATLFFDQGISKSAAWDHLTRMFRGGAASLVPGCHTLFRQRKSLNAVPVCTGEIFTYSSENDMYYVKVRTWSPFDCVRYQVQTKKEFSSGDHRYRDTMTFRLAEQSGIIVVNIRRTNKCTVSLLHGRHLKQHNPNGLAYGVLSMMVGPKGSGATAWAGGWKQLPAEVDSTVVEPDLYTDADDKDE